MIRALNQTIGADNPAIAAQQNPKSRGGAKWRLKVSLNKQIQDFSRLVGLDLKRTPQGKSMSPHQVGLRIHNPRDAVQCCIRGHGVMSAYDSSRGQRPKSVKSMGPRRRIKGAEARVWPNPRLHHSGFNRKRRWIVVQPTKAARSFLKAWGQMVHAVTLVELQLHAQFTDMIPQAQNGARGEACWQVNLQPLFGLRPNGPRVKLPPINPQIHGGGVFLESRQSCAMVGRALSQPRPIVHIKMRLNNGQQKRQGSANTYHGKNTDRVAFWGTCGGPLTDT